MWIKLISPEVTMRPMDSAFKKQMAPPLSLLVLGALTPRHHRVTIADENIERIVTTDSPDLVGITVKADTVRRAREISASYRRRGIPVVVGGIHPTACPEENAVYADACVIGEAEELWEDVIADAQKRSLKQYYRAARPPDLALTPVPRWELIADKNYLYTNTLTIGRGCPWRCSFCYNSSPNIPSGYRMKPVERVLREIHSLNSRHVMFIDDNFIADPSYARKLIRAMLPLDLTWHTAVSADINKYDDILDLMKASGCRSLFIGFESLSDQNLRSAGKRQNHADQYEEIIRKIHDRGMMVNASVVFGFDGDGPGVFGKTVDWLIRNKVETMTAHILTPYPGTGFNRELLKGNRIVDFDLRHYNTSRAVFRPAGMTAEQLEKGYRGAYRRFYSWRGILKRLPADRGRWVPFLLFNLFYRKYGKPVAWVFSTFHVMRFFGKLGAVLSYAGLRERKSSAEVIEQNAWSLQ